MIVGNASGGSSGPASEVDKVEVMPEVEAEALAKLVTRIYRIHGAPGELPG